MGIDEAGRHQLAAGVDGLVGLLIHLADGYDPVTSDPHIGRPGGAPHTVDDASTPDQVVEHTTSHWK